MSTSYLLPVGSAPEAESTTTQQRLKRENLVLRLALGIFTAGGFFCGLCAHRLTSPTVGGIAGLGAPEMEPLSAYAVPQTKKHEKVLRVSGDHVPHVDGWVVEDISPIPEFFDTRTQWQGCGTFVVDQRQCGDCWAASAANVLGDRYCIHLLEEGKPIPLPYSGALGSGILERKFQQAGKCIAEGTMYAAHAHGCKRGAFFANPQALVSCGNMNNTAPPTYHPYEEGSGYQAGHALYPSSAGCNGGEANDAWRFMYHEGLTIMDSSENGGCTSYTSGTCSGEDPKNNGCRPCEFSQCEDTGLKPERLTVDTFGWIMEEDLPVRGSWNPVDESFGKEGTDKYRPASQKAAMDRQVKKMQIEMMTNGPLHTCIDDYANFQLFYNQYPQGIYNSTEGTPKVGGHCIELMGWGTDRATGMNYWTWKNSWGVNFANGGFARIIRGVDLLGIESDVWVGCPSGSHCELTAGVVHNETWIPNHAYFPANKAEVKNASTSATKPSRSWPGGKEMLLSRKAFSHGIMAPLVVAAVHQAYANSQLTDSDALAQVSRVWSRNVRGLRLRVEMKGLDRHVIVTRHMEGHVTVQ